MPRERYQDSLDELRANVIGMGEQVIDQLDKSLRSAATHDESLARAVIDGDDEINERYLRLENRCVDLFALQQPVASDLRFVTASFKIITDLERIGDLATNLSRYALSGSSTVISESRIQTIGETASGQVRRAIEAYADADPEACRTIADRDDELDTLCQNASEAVVRELIAGESDRWGIEQLLDDVSRLLLTIRDLERVGDHAVNIAARTLYMDESDPELIY
ncbi:phosphate transport system regulatory protein PhoU [Halorubrum persicum]|uniref:Phosphate-specific transport system accessory protein PhoU n=1 Tax=Halorubrum persicum TaxID=1383844 RepID=A0A2G1WEL6_9EURY|nr:phosphate signaling complex protein PhoU [Halorubrum persicum]PHQ37420.1 phosphate transport system regulatory protein PhoU [Halorubrum persicum]